ncbi:related to carboxyphosphonoenolpyruvate phosphonomutase [Cephalotrichum gorgonifer]|uniref:Related to carboxyphosphonoenolpyruvate phosphonomutase n=1 Tax=Cephalotrichum gorgonifer TaxID=2041049 RepID=A0AAE8SZQ2_9PEZI|nr:related to carboxyphosphonoenolpyruvate phosphonomutase [Cephalotrichum gorgonifer]
MSRLGMPDLGVATLNDMRDTAGMIASLDHSVPLIADADTGYGGPLMVGRTVTEYIRAGVSALHLEDQVTTKRCGHLLNKQLVEEDEFLARIKAAVMARRNGPGDIVIIARTDALQSLGYEMARDRLKKAIALGADVAFLEGVRSAEEGRRICEELKPTPVLFNCVPGGISPELSPKEAADLGFRIAIYPGFALAPVYGAVSRAARSLKGEGNEAVRAEFDMSPKSMFEVCGLREAMEFDIEAGGKLYTGGV